MRPAWVGKRRDETEPDIVDALMRAGAKVERLHPNAADLSGRRFGRLYVLGPSPQRISGYVSWDCFCNCGKTVVVSAKSLREGRQSCGCAVFTSSVARKCPICSKSFMARWRARDGRHSETCSIKCSFKHRDVLGNKNPNWKDGATEKNHSIRLTAAYRRWRAAVLKRDRYQCVECGSENGYLHADHIKPFAVYPELRLEISNGRTLCAQCHRATDTWGRGVRRAARRDVTEFEIVKALRAVGARVVRMNQPCDLLVNFRDVLYLLEIDGITQYRKRAAAQSSFLAEWGVPRVKTPEQALKAIGAM